MTRVFVTALLLSLNVICCGCDDLLGSDESGVRLLLYASPRQPSANGQHALIGAEAVSSGSALPQYGMCVQLTAQLGTFGSQLGGPVEPAPDGGMPSCPSAHCTFVTLPPGNLRRDFAIYVSPGSSSQDIIYGALFQTPDAGTCPVSEAVPISTSVLTLQVPDVPIVSAADMSAAADMSSSDGGAE